MELSKEGDLRQDHCFKSQGNLEEGPRTNFTQAGNLRSKGQIVSKT